MELNFYSKIPYSDWKIPTTGFISKFSLTIWKCIITLINFVHHRPILHQKCPYFLDLIKWFRKKPDLPTYEVKWQDRVFSEPFDQI